MLFLTQHSLQSPQSKWFLY